MTNKNIQDVVAEFDLILDDIETDNDNGEHNVGYYRSSYKQRLEETLTQLVKEVEQIEKAFGGCTKCYGKGYSTEQIGEARGRGITFDVPKIVMNYCSCDRGKQLKELNNAK